MYKTLNQRNTCIFIFHQNLFFIQVFEICAIQFLNSAFFVDGLFNDVRTVDTEESVNQTSHNLFRKLVLCIIAILERNSRKSLVLLGQFMHNQGTQKRGESLEFVYVNYTLCTSTCRLHRHIRFVTVR